MFLRAIVVLCYALMSLSPVSACEEESASLSDTLYTRRDKDGKLLHTLILSGKHRVVLPDTVKSLRETEWKAEKGVAWSTVIPQCTAKIYPNGRAALVSCSMMADKNHEVRVSEYCFPYNHTTGLFDTICIQPKVDELINRVWNAYTVLYNQNQPLQQTRGEYDAR